MPYVEAIAAVFGLLCVWFFVVRSFWSWPTGLVQVLLLIGVFLQARLYADMALHVVYVGLQVFGWWNWWRSRSTTETMPHSDRPIEVRSLTRYGWLVSFAATLAMFVIFAGVLTSWTNADRPLPDSFIAATSLTAQFLLACRYVENWLLWLVVDTVGIWLFAIKGLYPTSLLYVVFWGMAVVGFRSWLQALRAQRLGSAQALRGEPH